MYVTVSSATKDRCHHEILKMPQIFLWLLLCNHKLQQLFWYLLSLNNACSFILSFPIPNTANYTTCITLNLCIKRNISNNYLSYWIYHCMPLTNQSVLSVELSKVVFNITFTIYFSVFGCSISYAEHIFFQVDNWLYAQTHSFTRKHFSYFSYFYVSKY